jgi:hypothetical protein
MASPARIATSRPLGSSPPNILKHKNPHAEAAVRDRMTGDTISIKIPVRAP